MKLYAIRHKPTGRYIPAPAKKDRAPASWLEPSNARPRFFYDRKSALVALASWLKGKREGGIHGHLTLQSRRKREDMEIVVFLLDEAGIVEKQKPSTPRREQPAKLLARVHDLMRQYPVTSALEVAKIFDCHPVYASHVLRTLTRRKIAVRLYDRGNKGEYRYSLRRESHEQRETTPAHQTAHEC